MMQIRYFLIEGAQAEREVTMEEFVRAERRAGFRPKPGCGPVATGGFDKTVPGHPEESISGRIEYDLASGDGRQEG